MNGSPLKLLRFGSFVLLIALSLLTSCEIPEPVKTTGSISGVVYCNEEPLSGVNINILPDGYSYISKADGSYSFLDLSPEQYTLTFTKKGYTPVTKTIKVTAGSNSTGDVSMELDPNILKVSCESLNFAAEHKNLSITLTNTGSASLSWSATLEDKPQWISLSKDSGILASNGNVDLVLTVDRSKIKDSEASTILKIVASNGQSYSINISVTAGEPATAFILVSDVTDTTVYFKILASTNSKGVYYGIFDSADITNEELITYGDYTPVPEDYTYSISLFELDPETEYHIYVIPVNKYDQKGKMVTTHFTTKEISSEGGDDDPEDGISTTAEVLAGTDGVVYRVKGEVATIENNEFGNWYLQDNYGKLYIYGTLDANGNKKNFSSLGIEMGDIVTCEGVRKLYIDKIELVDVKVINIEKRPFKISISTLTSTSVAATITPNSTTKPYLYQIEKASYVDQFSTDIELIEADFAFYKEWASDNGKNFTEVMQMISSKGETVISNEKLSPNTEYYIYGFGLSDNYSKANTRVVKQKFTTPASDTITMQDYLGYWDLYATDFDNKQDTKFERLLMAEYKDPDNRYNVALYGLMGGAIYRQYHAIGKYNKELGTIDLYGRWGINITHTFNGDDSIKYRSYFTPIYAVNNKYEYVSNSVGYDAPIVRLKIDKNNRRKLDFGGVPDALGRSANGYLFEEYFAETGEFNRYRTPFYNVHLERSANQSPSSSKVAKMLNTKLAKLLIQNTEYQPEELATQARNDRKSSQ